MCRRSLTYALPPSTHRTKPAFVRPFRVTGVIEDHPPHTSYPFNGGDIRLGRTVGLFTILAILLTCLGIFGLAAYAAERRTNRIGPRFSIPRAEAHPCHETPASCPACRLLWVSPALLVVLVDAASHRARRYPGPDPWDDERNRGATCEARVRPSRLHRPPSRFTAGGDRLRASHGSRA